MAETAAHPAPPNAAGPPPAAEEAETSERIFRRRLIRALTSFNFRELRAMWREDLVEPHMHLFVLLVAAFALGVLIWLVEPMML